MAQASPIREIRLGYPEIKSPESFPARGKKKRQGPVAPAHGVGYSGLMALNADRRRDWHPGGGSCNMCQFSVLHGKYPTRVDTTHYLVYIELNVKLDYLQPKRRSTASISANASRGN